MSRPLSKSLVADGRATAPFAAAPAVLPNSSNLAAGNGKGHARKGPLMVNDLFQFEWGFMVEFQNPEISRRPLSERTDIGKSF
jgi:hypothetical protein